MTFTSLGVFRGGWVRGDKEARSWERCGIPLGWEVATWSAGQGWSLQGLDRVSEIGGRWG